MLGGPGEPDGKPLSSSVLSKDFKKTSTETAKASEKPNTEQDYKEADTSDEDKILKKPDKILPCPRCNSMDTNFCYYNNYNVNQPRHFCKNCQRYWTAGGTMRNVPVGAGRHKSKNKLSVSSYRHTIVTSEALALLHVDGLLSPFMLSVLLLFHFHLYLLPSGAACPAGLADPGICNG